MTYANRLRLACRTPKLPIPSPSYRPTSLPRARYPLTASRSWSKTPCQTVRWQSSTPGKGVRVETEQAAQEEDISEFKKQRRNDLAEASEGENPLLTEAYPRLIDSNFDNGEPAERYSVPEFHAACEDGLPEGKITLMGRVRSKRTAGSALMFLDIMNEFRKVQIMLNKKKMMLTGNEKNRQDWFSMFKGLVQVGDHISVTGVAVRTKTGALTLEATAMPEMLSPVMEQIPERLIDPKTKMQDRHVDMLVNKEVTDVLRLRSEVLKYMRDHFHSKRFLEFQTPILAENAGGAVARPFVTQATEFRGKNLAMRVAPELWLKRLVVAGVDRVFEIGPAFRNEGIDATHNPEFTMCEFYSAYTNLADLIKETEELITGLAERASNLINTDLDALPKVDMSKFKQPFKQVEFVPALEEALGFRFPKLSNEDALPELLAILKLAGISIPGDSPKTLPKLLDRLAALHLEPMSFQEPIFITHHPACMSPLSKSFICPSTYQLVSARAELFIGGRELANMYEEENNPEEQKRKLAIHRSMVNKEGGGIGYDGLPQDIELDVDGEASPLDSSFVKALDHGLPPTGGWGCGVERLVMLFSGASRISDCLSFGNLRNVVSLSADEAQKRDS